jgi:hypothetical protein
MPDEMKAAMSRAKKGVKPTFFFLLSLSFFSLVLSTGKMVTRTWLSFRHGVDRC